MKSGRLIEIRPLLEELSSLLVAYPGSQLYHLDGAHSQVLCNPVHSLFFMIEIHTSPFAAAGLPPGPIVFHQVCQPSSGSLGPKVKAIPNCLLRP
jgi:hypothetical protein